MVEKTCQVTHYDQAEAQKKCDLINQVPLKLPHKNLIFSRGDVLVQRFTWKGLNLNLIKFIVESCQTTYSEGRIQKD